MTITKQQRYKIMSIKNICNVIKPNNKDDVKFWVEKIKEICEEVIK